MQAEPKRRNTAVIVTLVAAVGGLCVCSFAVLAAILSQRSRRRAKRLARLSV